MIYAFDRCFFIKNSDEKSAKKVLGERLYTNKRIKLDFSYDIVEENDDFVTRKIIDDYCKASKEIDDYEFCELMYKDYSAKPYNINISELPAIDKESEEYQNYNPPFKGENLRISDSVELTRFKEENFDEKYGIITNIYKDMNSSDISIVGCEFRYKDELNFSYGREKGFKKAEDSAILELIERLAIYDVEGEIKKVSYDENNGLNLVNPEELLYYSQEFRNAGNKFDSSFPYKWLKVEEWGSNKGAYIPLQFFSMDVDDENYFVFESSNGVALGSSIYEAKLFALFELVERDAFLNFWYKKARLYRIDINSVEKKVQEKIARFETEDKKVYIFDMTFDISIPSILCLAVDFRGKVATYISTASHVNYNVAINAAVNECLVGHRIYETNPRIGEKEYNSDYDVVEMFDHVNHDDSIRVDIPQDETKIKKLMDEVMCLIYMEPDNPYNYHTTYASARGFNSNEIVLEIVGNHSRKIFIYNLTQNEFDLISREKCNEVSFVANMYIICNRGKIGRKYGDFGYILSLLDAGHFIENIKCFSIEEKLSFTLDYNPCTSIDMLRLPKPYQIVPLVKLDITDFFVKKQENLWDNENVNKVKFSDTYTGNKSGSLVDQFIDKVLESKVPIVEKFSNIRTSVKVKELLMRTSSQSAQGYSFFPYECPDDVLDEIIDSVKLSLADVTDDLICVQLVMNTDSVRVYEIKRDHVNTKELNDIDMNSLPHDSLDYVDLKNVSVGVIMYTNCKLYEMNEIWYQYTYIKMGEIAQRISNICGTKELSARPMKNMNDLYMKNRLMESDSYDPGYFIVIGKSMNDSLKMLMR